MAFIHQTNDPSEIHAYLLYYTNDPNTVKTSPVDVCYDTTNTGTGAATVLGTNNYDFTLDLETVKIEWGAVSESTRINSFLV